MKLNGVLALVCATLVLGCSDPDAAPQSAEENKPASESIVSLTDEVSFPFVLTGTDIQGTPIDLEQLIGKVTVVDIWGTWCPPCRREIPSFIKLQEMYGEQGLQMIGVNYEHESSAEANLATVTKFVADHGINYPCIMGEPAVKAQIPDMRGYPTTIFIDRTGKVRKMEVGEHPFEHLESIVKTLLAE